MNAVTEHPHSRAYLVVAVGLSYLAMMSLAIAVNLIPVFLTTFSVELGEGHSLTKEQLGRLGAVTFAGLVSAILVTGPLADRLGPRLFAVAGNLLIAAGLALLGAARSYAAVLLAAGLMGLGAGALDMVLSPIVAALQPRRRTTAMNWLHSFYCVGAVFTVLTGAQALEWGIPWRAVSKTLVFMPLAVAAGFMMLRLPPLIEQGRQRTRLRHLCRDRYFLLCLAAIFLAGATELGMAQWLPAYAEFSLSFSRYAGGMALLAFSVAMAFGRMLAGMLGDRVSPANLLLGCCGGSVVLFVVGCFAPWPPVALAACVGAGLAGSCLWPSMLGVASDRFPSGGASMFGLLAALGNFGGIFMPWVVGAIADRAALNWGLATATLCPLLMGAVLLWMRRQPRPAEQLVDAQVQWLAPEPAPVKECDGRS